MSNIVYTAVSLDGFIADRDEGLDWLYAHPNPDNVDMGYGRFMQRIDALVMGRNTFEKVLCFDCAWPYEKHLFVLSHSEPTVPPELKEKVTIVSGKLADVLAQVHQQGYNNLYIDGGQVVQQFLKEDLIDELILTRFPILLGAGVPLFANLPKALSFDHVTTEIFLNQLVQSHYKHGTPKGAVPWPKR